MALHATGRRAIERNVSARTDFRHGNVSGRWYPTWADVPRGQYSGGVYMHKGPVFVVLSYATPIAMFSPDHGWTVPSVRYSATTTNHQSAVRCALPGQEVSA